VLAASRGARVNGLDAAEALVAIARQRVPDGDFRVGDLETLPYADETFDAVIAADVVPYVADSLTAVRELRRICAPTGRVVIAVWGVPGVSAYHLILTAAYDLLPIPLDRQPIALSAPGMLDALIVQAGLAIVDYGLVVCPCEYPDQETAWQAQVSRAIAPYGDSTGSVRLENRFRYLTAVP
jgi:SAM-dependent methyltransferase